MAGKYYPLLSHLASLDEGTRQLIMSFTDIEQLVGELPQSARKRREWWADANVGREPKVWQAAGWRVESVNRATGFVVFARDGGDVVPSTDGGPTPTTSPLPAAQDVKEKDGETTRVEAPSPAGEGQKPSTVISWRSIAGDVAVGVVAAAVTAVAAIVGLAHLPFLAIAILCFSVGFIGFTVSQAITTRKLPAAAQKWWSISTASLVLIGAGAFAYHKGLDPASASQALPFSAVVRTDSSPAVEAVDQGCRTVVLPGPWRNISIPPEPLSDTGVNQWEASHNGIDGNDTVVVVELQGTSDQTVVIDPPQLVVTSRGKPVPGSAALLSGGCGDTLIHRVFQADLDEQAPSVTLVTGAPYPPTQVEGNSASQASSPSFAVSASDPEYFVIIATTKTALCKWYIDLSWQSMGQFGTLRLENNGKEFQTTAIAGDPIHRLELGAWQ
jgi:hypothetical protein